MLTPSPPLPSVIEYIAIGDPDEITTEGEEPIVLTLEQRNLIRHIRLRMPVLELQKLFGAIEGLCGTRKSGVGISCKRE